MTVSINSPHPGQNGQSSVADSAGIGAGGHSNPATAPIEATLEALLQSLLEMGICASDVQESALESFPGGAGAGYPGGLVGRKAAQAVDHLSQLYSLKDTVENIHIPLEVINYVDAGKNPHMITRDFVERVAGENMYTNGILRSVSDYRDLLTSQMMEAFPELEDFLPKASPSTDGTTPSSSSTTAGEGGGPVGNGTGGNGGGDGDVSMQ